MGVFKKIKTKSKKNGLRRFTKQTKKKHRNLKKELFYGSGIGSNISEVNTKTENKPEFDKIGSNLDILESTTPMDKNNHVLEKYTDLTHETIIPQETIEEKNTNSIIPNTTVPQENNEKEETQLDNNMSETTVPQENNEKEETQLNNNMLESTVPQENNEKEETQLDNNMPETTVPQENNEKEETQLDNNMPETTVPQENNEKEETQLDNNMPETIISQENNENVINYTTPDTEIMHSPNENNNNNNHISNSSVNMKTESVNQYENEEELLNNISPQSYTPNIQSPIIPTQNMSENNNKIDLNLIVESFVDVIADKILKKLNIANNNTPAEKLNTALTSIESKSTYNNQQGAGYKRTRRLKYVYNPRTKTLRRKK